MELKTPRRRRRRPAFNSLDQRVERARATARPGEILGFVFTPTEDGFVVRAITDAELRILNEKPE